MYDHASYVCDLFTPNWNIRFRTTTFDILHCPKFELVDVSVFNLEHQLSFQIMLQIFNRFDVISSIVKEVKLKKGQVLVSQSGLSCSGPNVLDALIVELAYCTAVG